MTTETTTRPILFSGPMVKAILTGVKTQTRRVIDMRPLAHSGQTFRVLSEHGAAFYGDISGDLYWRRCPYGAPGDRLWVRETWCCITGDIASDEPSRLDAVAYRADDSEANEVISSARAWKPSIHMPRAYSRITLEAIAVRVERVQDISEEDAQAEGVDYYDGAASVPARERFAALWNSINAARGYGWDANPWVFVIEFRRVQP